MSEGRSLGKDLLVLLLLASPFVAYEFRDRILDALEPRRIPESGAFVSKASAPPPLQRLSPVAAEGPARAGAGSVGMVLGGEAARPQAPEPEPSSPRAEPSRPAPARTSFNPPRLVARAIGSGVSSWFGGARHASETTSASVSGGAASGAASRPAAPERPVTAPLPEAPARPAAPPVVEEQRSAPPTGTYVTVVRQLPPKMRAHRVPIPEPNPCRVSPAPGVEVDESTRHFDVEGTSVSELILSANQRIPPPGRGTPGKDAIGRCDYSVGPRCEFEPRGESLCTSRCVVTVQALKHIPRWNGSEPKDVAAEWADEQAHIQAHEDTHAMIALQQANALKAELDQLGDAPCRDLARKVDDLTLRINSQFKPRQQAFDASGALVACPR